jgi:hypothetical protein
MEVVLEEDVEIDDRYTKNLIEGVISDGVSGSESDGHGFGSRKRSKQKDLGFLAKENKNGKRPDFELEDIMGEFEIDDSGNYIIMRGEDGKLLDKNMKQVNQRGYLIDRAGNIVNKKQELIFKHVELDSDEEIPAPIGFDKRKQNLLNMKHENIDEVFDEIV